MNRNIINNKNINKRLAVIVAAALFILNLLFIYGGIHEKHNPGMNTIVINPGHSQGYEKGKAVNGLVEADINAAIAGKVGMLLKKSGYNVYLTHPVGGFVGKVLVTNAEATAAGLNNMAKRINAINPDVVISIHCNYSPNNPSATGYELYWSSYKPKLDKEGMIIVSDQWGDGIDGRRDKTPCPEALQSKELANILKKNFDEGLESDLSPRPNCIHERDDSLPRETACPAVLIETGFLSNASDAAYLTDTSNQYKIAECIKKSVDQFLNHWEYDNGDVYLINGLGEKQTGWQSVKEQWYYLGTGTGKRLTGLQTIGNKTYYFNANGVMQTGWQQIKGKWYYFSPEDGAMQRSKWISDRYVKADGSMARSESVQNGRYTVNEFGIKTLAPPEGDFIPSTEIMGAQTVSASRMMDILDRNAPFDSEFYNMTLSDFVHIVIDEADIEGVRPEVIFAQIILETGFLTYSDSVVQPEQYNFGGLGVLDIGGSGNSFPDVRTGIRAQVQHMKAYASTAPLTQTCVDSRFKYVKRGSAKTIGELGNGNWSSDPDYADKLLWLLNRMKLTRMEL